LKFSQYLGLPGSIQWTSGCKISIGVSPGFGITLSDSFGASWDWASF
ncbi:11390_t:CDS:2, partial [Ambispora leptoticha]